MRRYLFATAIACAALTSSQSSYAQVPTIDLSSLAQLKNMLTTATQTLNQITQTLNTINAVKQQIGNVGSLDLSSVAGFSDLLGSNSAVSSLLQQVGPSMSAIQGIAQAGGNLASLNGLGSGSASFGSLTSTQTLVKNLLYPGPSSTMGGHDQVMAARSLAAENAAVEGYALALATKQTGSQGQQAINDLQSVQTAAQSERGSIAANSAIALAQYQQGQQILAVLAQQLLVESSAQIAQDNEDTLSTSAAQATTSQGSAH